MSPPPCAKSVPLPWMYPAAWNPRPEKKTRRKSAPSSPPQNLSHEKREPPLSVADGRTLLPLPRRGVGRAGPRRPVAIRAFDSRRRAGGLELAHRFEETRELPRGV